MQHDHPVGGLHDVPSVAATLVCSESKVRRLVAEGRLQAYKLGHRSLRFSDEQIDAFLSSHQVVA